MTMNLDLLNKVTLASCLLLVTAYAASNPLYAPSGDSLLGLILGGVAAVFVLLLMFLGIKKRWLIGRFGTQQAWVHAHHYTGVALLVIALLHAGFQFDANIHGFLSLLLWVLVLTGIFGSLSYRFIPRMLNRLHDTVAHDALFERLQTLDQRILACTAEYDAAMNAKAWYAFRNANYQHELSPLGTLVPAWLRRPGGEFFGDAVQASLEGLGELREHEVLVSLADLLDTRQTLVRKNRMSKRFELALGLWRKVHACVSVLFVALLVLHVVISFQY